MTNDGFTPFEAPDPIVTPRNRNFIRRPVIAVLGDYTLDENMELGKVADLTDRLLDLPPTLFTAILGADFVAELDEHFAPLYPHSWQWRAIDQEREIRSMDGKLVGGRVTTNIYFFGFKNGNYHKIIDPVSMYGQEPEKVIPGDTLDIVGLLDWGIFIRDFCDENNLEVRPTIGAVSRQFLTDPRFYPSPRRKVPRAINDAIRELLPGNFYHLTVYPSPKREYRAHYLDQHRAHHYHARNTSLPHADDLYAHGRFMDLSECVLPGWNGFHGLLCVDLDRTKARRLSRFVIRWLRLDPATTKHERVFVYTNELDFLLSYGVEITGIRAAWGSCNIDTGIPAFAEWAETQLDRYEDAGWLKPLLLSTYGTLATRPKAIDAIFRLAKHGKPTTLLTGRRSLTGLLIEGRRKLEPGIANVLHRAMIESATRIESISYATYLESKGYRILSIYADAVMVHLDDDKELPLIVEPWRLKKTLNNLQFINKTAFISDGMTKLPGNFREAIPYRQSSPGVAPRVVKEFEVGSGRVVWVNKLTGKEVR